MPADDEPPAGPLPALPGAGRDGAVLTSPARRSRLDGAETCAGLRPWDLGRWTGRPLRELPPAELTAWREDPSWAGHGGESLQQLADRVGSLLENWRGRSGRLVAVTHAGVVRAAVTTALRSPAASAWDLDVAASSVTELHTSGRGWRVVRVGCPL